jgi:dihydropyrimidinase
MAVIIKGGKLVTAIDSYTADLLVEDGKIAEIGIDLAEPAGADVYDAAGKLVLPGVIDAHVHVDLELRGHASSGFLATTREAAFGGVTSFLTYVTPRKGEGLMEAVNARRAQADGQCYVDYGLHASLIRWDDREDDEIPRMIEAGIPSFKMYTVYSDAGLASEENELYQAFLLAGRHGGLIEVHCENEWMIESRITRLTNQGRLSAADHAESRPGYAEGEAVAAVVRVAYDAGAPVYIVHVSSGEAVKTIAEAKDLGIDVFAETCPHFLLLDEEKLAGADGQRFATCPPIRSDVHREELWNALEEELIQVVATDHAEFMSEAKDEGAADFRKIPMGVPGIGTLLPLMWQFGVREGRLTENGLVDLLSTHPAEIFGLCPEKGTLSPETDADIIIFDPALDVTITPDILHGYTDYSPYEGLKVTGWPVGTMVRGNWVVKDRELVGSHELGSFIKRGKVCQRPGHRAK